MSINETRDKLASLPAGKKVAVYTEGHISRATKLTTNELKELAEWVRGVQGACVVDWHYNSTTATSIMEAALKEKQK